MVVDPIDNHVSVIFIDSTIPDVKRYAPENPIVSNMEYVEDNLTENMHVDDSAPKVPYKKVHKTMEEPIFDDEEIKLIEWDVKWTLVDGLISIDFSKRVQELAVKSLDQTVVVNLLGRKIDYTTLRSKIYELWKPSQAIQIMDIGNDYFLVIIHTRPNYLQAIYYGS
ncbi:hypothetical protein GQ457_01G016070 [Hibiscus cannabinus]